MSKVKTVDPSANGALVPVGETIPEVAVDSPYLIARMEREDLAEILHDNLGNDGIQANKLDRVKIPSGGSPVFTISTVEGEDAVKTMTGVVVGWRDNRGYWAKSIDEDGGGKPPLCFSPDGRNGYGDPGGECAVCPYSQFQGDEKPKCKSTVPVYFLEVGKVIPSILQLPVSSLQVFKSYCRRLANEALFYWAVETEVGLVKAKNATGIDYSEATFRLTRRLEPDERSKFRDYKTTVGNLIDAADEHRILQIKIAASEAAQQSA